MVLESDSVSDKLKENDQSSQSNVEKKVNCVCKGIRKCAICAPNLIELEKDEEISIFSNLNERKVYIYCTKCNLSTLVNESNRNDIENFLNAKDNHQQVKDCCSCHKQPESNKLNVNGIFVLNDFINENEETYLFNQINQTKWNESQSGRFKQDFGPKANFNKKKLKYSTFTGLPRYAKFLVDRFNCSNLDQFKNFIPVELCNLRYESERAACIDPHIDDIWLWGNRLITINLLTNTYLTLMPGSKLIDELGQCEILIPLCRRSLIILSDDARYDWLHAIKKTNIKSTRIAITLRELSDEYLNETKQGKLGKQIQTLALTFNGVSVGCIEELNLSTIQHQRSANLLNQSIPDTNSLKDLIKQKCQQLNLINENENIDFELIESNSPYSRTYLMRVEHKNNFLIELNKTTQENKILLKRDELIKKLNSKFNKQYFYEFKENINNSEWSISLHEFDNKWKILKENARSIFDERVLLLIGKSVAEWSLLLQKELSSMADDEFYKNILKFESHENLLILSNDFDSYKRIFTEALKTSEMELATKSKAIAVIHNIKCQIDELKKRSKSLEDCIGLVVNDFGPNKFLVQQAEGNGIILRNLHSFQNVTFSFYLYDLAVCVSKFLILNPDDSTKIQKNILNGYECAKYLNEFDLKFLRNLILICLIFEALKLEKLKLLNSNKNENEKNLNLNQILDLFNQLYLENI